MWTGVPYILHAVLPTSLAPHQASVHTQNSLGAFDFPLQVPEIPFPPVHLLFVGSPFRLNSDVTDRQSSLIF